jgi:hypothetical protein
MKLALATLPAPGALAAQTAVQRSTRTAMYVGIIPGELTQAVEAAHGRPTPNTTAVPTRGTP